MLQIGQIRKNASGTYLSPLSKYSSSVYISWYDNGKVFEDYALHLGTEANPQPFRAKTTYYLRFSATRQDSNLQPAYGGEISNFDFSLVLYQERGTIREASHTGEKTQTIEKSLNLGPYQEGVNSRTKEFTIVFTPNEDYNFLCFKLGRIGYDYIIEARNPFIYEGPGDPDNTLDFDDNGDVCVVNSILDVGVAAVDKIGIQSRPGALFCVNREPIRLGRSGVYEINNGTQISFVGVMAPNGDDTTKIQDFILDYAYIV